MRTDTESTVQYGMDQSKNNLQAAEDFKLELADARREMCELEKQLAAERALADRLADALKELLYYDLQDVNLGRLKSSRDALAAWKEARSE